MLRIRKALVVLVTSLLTLGAQWQATGEFNLSTEGVTAILGVVTAVLVYYVPNLLSDGLAGVRKALVPLGTVVVGLVVQVASTGDWTVTQETYTAVLGVVTALLVYWVPNAGQEHPETRPI